MKIGEHIPTFSLEDNKGNWFNSDEFLHKKILCVVFFIQWILHQLVQKKFVNFVI